MSACCKVVIAISLLAGAACAARDDPPQGADVEETAQTTAAVTLDERLRGCASDPRVVAGLVSQDICAGADLFLRETFSGNGRSCATCHRVDHNFTIDVDFIDTLPFNDPLFVAEFNGRLSQLEMPDQMRGHGLILENLDGFLPDPTTRFVLRSVPHNLSMGTSVTRAPGDTVTVPADRTGWSGDGAPGNGTLRDFQTGAITQHYTKNLARVPGRDFRLATDGELDRIDLFMRQLGRTNELDLTTVVMTDAGAEAGRTAFLTVGCNACHANAGANAGFGGGGSRNFNTGVESSRNPELATFPIDGGFLATPANADGSFGNGTFNAPPLVEAADTGPFFHTDVSVTGASAYNTPTATTIEEAIAFYDSPAFNNSPSGQARKIDLTKEQIDNIGRFLRGVNATFNVAMAVKRLDASAVLVGQLHSSRLTLQRELLRLANVEINDAITDLEAVEDLDADALADLCSVRSLIDQARFTLFESIRAARIASARSILSALNAKIGSNLTYQIGDATIMF